MGDKGQGFGVGAACDYEGVPQEGSLCWRGSPYRDCRGGHTDPPCDKLTESYTRLPAYIVHSCLKGNLWGDWGGGYVEPLCHTFTISCGIYNYFNLLKIKKII